MQFRDRGRLGKFVSVEIAKQLIGSGKIRLGGENMEATILFSDIRNFTTMSSKMPAEDVVHFLNDYFSHITVPIAENNGVINKFIGDAVMAVFTPQFGSKDHVDDALHAALGMREALAAKCGKINCQFVHGVRLGEGGQPAGGHIG